jgi:hypothetical protein
MNGRFQSPYVRREDIARVFALMDNQIFVKSSATQLVNHLSQSAPDVQASISPAIRTSQPGAFEQHKQQHLTQMTAVRDQAAGEQAGDSFAMISIYLPICC